MKVVWSAVLALSVAVEGRASQIATGAMTIAPATAARNCRLAATLSIYSHLLAPRYSGQAPSARENSGLWKSAGRNSGILTRSAKAFPCSRWQVCGPGW